MFKVFCYVWKESFKQMFRLRNILVNFIGVAIGSFGSYGVIRAYLHYKMYLGDNVYINNRLLTFIYENGQIVEYEYSIILMCLTTILGHLVIINLPWFKFKIKIDEEKVEQLLDEAMDEDYDDF